MIFACAAGSLDKRAGDVSRPRFRPGLGVDFRFGRIHPPGGAVGFARRMFPATAECNESRCRESPGHVRPPQFFALDNRTVLGLLFMLPAAALLLLFLTYPLGLGT